MYRTKKTLPKRIFVVGCPRSGTTLLQSILLTNSAIISFPESHFFVNLFRRRSELRKTLNLASQYSRPGFEDFMREAGYTEIRKSLPKYALSLRQHTGAFTQTLDAIAQRYGKSIWIEKTPDHVNFIEFIETHVRDALFIHIVRHGPDVVASLYDVTYKYPLEWEGPWDVERCLRKWMTCVTSTFQHCHKSNHLMVNYENLVNDSALVSQTIGDFIGAELDAASLRHRQGAFKKIALHSEPWKAHSGQAIYQKTAHKFATLFDSQQQAYILETISNAGLIDLENPRVNRQREHHCLAIAN